MIITFISFRKGVKNIYFLRLVQNQRPPKAWLMRTFLLQKEGCFGLFSQIPNVSQGLKKSYILADVTGLWIDLSRPLWTCPQKAFFLTFPYFLADKAFGSLYKRILHKKTQILNCFLKLLDYWRRTDIGVLPPEIWQGKHLFNLHH